MPINTNDEGSSVYITESRETHDKKADHPLYKSARELVHEEIPKDALVIELGCSDLPASGKLSEEGYTVVGVELDPSAAEQGKKFYPNANVVIGDVTNLPLGEIAGDKKVILLLDVLEHLEHEQAVEALKFLREHMGNHTIIVSMPNLSPFSYLTWKEGLPALIKRERPETRLWDRTHKILTDIRGHKELFDAAGYEVVRMETTREILGEQPVTGKWDWMSSEDDYSNREYGPRYKAYKFLSGEVMGRIASVVRNVSREEGEMISSGYQGLYLLKPKNNNS